MFVLSVAALAVYWKYIRENIPLDFHHPVNHSRSNRSSSHIESPEQENIGGPDIGNAVHATVNNINSRKSVERFESCCSNQSYFSESNSNGHKELIMHI